MNKCSFCMNEFEPKNRSDEKYCSSECRRKGNLRRISERNSGKVKDGIKCEVCGQMLKAISNTHLKKHDMTMEKYKEQFGVLRSEETNKRRKEARANVDYVEKARKHKETHRKVRITKYGELTPRQMQICYGGLLGDFGIHAYSKNRLAGNYLECYHGEKQVPYLKWIQEEFKNFDCKFNEWTRYWEEYGREYTRYWITTACHPTFTELRQFVYADSGLGEHKVVTREWLDKLEPLGLAVWFMDDGTLQTQTRHVCLCTQGFSYNEHLLIQQYFKEKWQIATSIPRSGKDGQYYIYFIADGSKKFVKLIRPFLLEMFHYKIEGV